jgi:hypothetical protein
MSKYEHELKKRLDSVETTHEIVEWYLRSMATDASLFAEVERRFWQDIIDLYFLGKKYGSNFKGVMQRSSAKVLAPATLPLALRM